MWPKIFFLTLFGILLCQTEISAQTPNYSGTWNLNFEKTTLDHQRKGLTASVFIIKQDGEKFSLTRYHIFDKKKKKISVKAIADGKTRKVKLLFKCKPEQKQDGLLVTLWRKNYLNIVHYKFGKDQNELIADETYQGHPQNHQNIWIFDQDFFEF